MVADYRYYFGSLRSPGVIAEIALYGTYMDMEMNIGGSFNGSFQLDQTGKRNQDLIDATIPGFSFVMVERNGVVIWGGYIWSRTYQSQSKDVQLFAQSFDMYPNNQIVETDLLAALGVHTDDVRNWMCRLWNQMQSIEFRNLGITIPTAGSFSGGFQISGFGTLATDLKTYGELMAEIANGNGTNGFDWYISCARVDGQYVRQLNIGNPNLGQSLVDTSLVFEYPGVITNYYQVESMVDAGTNIFMTGSGDGSSITLATTEQTTMLTQQGWPRWDQAVPAKDVSSTVLLDLLAAQEAINRKPPKLTVRATMKASSIVPDFGGWGLGDIVRVVAKDARNPSTLSFPGKIVKWTLNPPLADNVEEYTLIFAGDDNA